MRWRCSEPVGVAAGEYNEDAFKDLEFGSVQARSAVGEMTYMFTFTSQ